MKYLLPQVGELLIFLLFLFWHELYKLGTIARENKFEEFLNTIEIIYLLCSRHFGRVRFSRNQWFNCQDDELHCLKMSYSHPLVVRYSFNFVCCRTLFLYFRFIWIQRKKRISKTTNSYSFRVGWIRMQTTS